MLKKVVLNFLLLLPIIFMALSILVIEVAEPVKEIYTITGISAGIILFISIVISFIKKRINLIKYRKTVGLYGFFYSFLHLINFVVFDAFFDLAFIVKETLDKPFIYLGMLAFFILLFMAITSRKTLFKKFNKYHRLVYLALILITIHYTMAQKSINFDDLIYILIVSIVFYYKLRQILEKKKIHS